jgi:hypothetical protein
LGKKELMPKEEKMAKKMFKLGMLVIVLVFGLTAVGCDDDSDNYMRLTLADNFAHNFTYQGRVTAQQFINGLRIQAGDEFILRVTFTASRDLEGQIWVFLTDMSQAANGWELLSETDNIVVTWEEAATGIREFSAEIILRATETAASAAWDANFIIFETWGEGNVGEAGSGVKGPVVLTFSQFEFFRR